MTFREKATAVVLGGTVPHIALLQRLRTRGYRTVVVDYLESPPAAEHADLHIKESTLDERAVLRVAESVEADLVISACVDQANVTACYVGEKLNLSIPYSFQTALNVSRKPLMKRILIDAGVKTSRFAEVKSAAEIASTGLNYPIMVKPADSCSSNAVKKATSQRDAERFFEEARQASRTGSVLVEEFVDGHEVSVYAFASDRDAKILLTAERHTKIDGPSRTLKCYCTTAPARISEKAEKSILGILQKIAESFGLTNTPIHLQVLIDGDDVNVIEFAPRVGGGLSYETILRSTGFDIIEATIDSYLGTPVVPLIKTNGASFAISIIYGSSGEFNRIEGVEEVLREGLAESFYQYKQPGAIIAEEKSSSSRLGAFVVRFENFPNLWQKIASICTRIDAYDKAGNSILRRDISTASKITPFSD